MEKFKIEIIAKHASPQLTIWRAMHQDYSSRPVYDIDIDETRAGDLIVTHLLKGGRGHFGPLEHPHITLNCCYFPHSVVQQLRTHRIGVSFDVQSFRYTGNQIIAASKNKLLIEEVFYVRPCGTYNSREGAAYFYGVDQRNNDLASIAKACDQYASKREMGMSEEQARGGIPFDYRQHFVATFNVRSLMHMLDLRAKKDAQLECQVFAKLLMIEFEKWCPELSQWYQTERMGKAKLAP